VTDHKDGDDGDHNERYVVAAGDVPVPRHGCPAALNGAIRNNHPSVEKT